MINLFVVGTRSFSFNSTAASNSFFPNGTKSAISTLSCVDSFGVIVSNQAYPVGYTYFNCTAIDSFGVSSSCLFYVQIVDTEPPKITCPNNQNVTTDPGKSYFTETATFENTLKGTITFSDNVDSSSVLAQTLVCIFPSSLNASVSGLPQAYVINCTIHDSSYNYNSCAFSITVEDKEPPTLTGIKIIHEI